MKKFWFLQEGRLVYILECQLEVEHKCAHKYLISSHYNIYRKIKSFFKSLQFENKKDILQLTNEITGSSMYL